MAKPKIKIDLGEVEKLASQGLTNEQIAQSLGIGRTTLQARKRESEQFEQAIKRGQAKGIAFVSNKLMEQCEEGNTTAMIFFLKARANWSDKMSVEHLGADGGPIQFQKIQREIIDPQDSNA